MNSYRSYHCHQYSSCRDQDNPCCRFPCQFFVEYDPRESNRHEDTQLIDRYNNARRTFLQCSVIKKPGCSCCNSGKSDKKKFFFLNFPNLMLFSFHKYHQPCHNQIQLWYGSQYPGLNQSRKYQSFQGWPSGWQRLLTVPHKSASFHLSIQLSHRLSSFLVIIIMVPIPIRQTQPAFAQDRPS